MRPDKGSKRLRKGRRSVTNQAYLITTSTIQREKILQSASAANIVMESLQWQVDQASISLDAAVVMPDHVHFVAELKRTSLPHLMRRFKNFTAVQINKALNRQGPVWLKTSMTTRIGVAGGKFDAFRTNKSRPEPAPTEWHAACGIWHGEKSGNSRWDLRAIAAGARSHSIKSVAGCLRYALCAMRYAPSWERAPAATEKKPGEVSLPGLCLLS
jgi:REP element-mobilizing transposase RayT